MSVQLTIPEVGESVTEVHVGKWLKSEGDHVDKDQVVVELESEKANFELPSPVSGMLKKIFKKEGDAAKVTEAIAIIEEDGKSPPPEGSKGGAEAKPPAAKPASQAKAQEAPRKPRVEQGPSAKKPAEEAAPSPRENQAEADAEAVTQRTPQSPLLAEKETASPAEEAPAKEDTSTTAKPPEPTTPPRRQGVEKEEGEGKEKGENERAEKEEEGEESKATVKAQSEKKEPTSKDKAEDPEVAEAGPPKPPAASHREEQTVPMSPMRKAIARHLVAAQHEAALLTTFNEIDISAVIELRKRHGDDFQKQYGVKLGFMSFFVKAAIDALGRFPIVNARVEGDKIIHQRYMDIGIAVSTERGLVVPVLRDADRMGFGPIEQAIVSLADRAGRGQLEPDDLRGGTFTISNGGVFGSLMSTPIVKPPQSAVLGMHAIQDRPVAIDKQVVVRPMMYVALTYDHRIIDGKEAVSFLRRIKEVVEQPARMLIEI